MTVLCAVLRLSLISTVLTIPAISSLTVVHFDDLTAQPADGLTHLGVVYSFMLGGTSSTDAVYGAAFPSDSVIGTTVLAGPAGDLNTPSSFGILTLSFDVPTDVFTFAIALNTGADDIFSLVLTDDLGAPGTPILVSTSPDPACDSFNQSCFSEAIYTYSGLAPIGSPV